MAIVCIDSVTNAAETAITRLKLRYGLPFESVISLLLLLTLYHFHSTRTVVCPHIDAHT